MNPSKVDATKDSQNVGFDKATQRTSKHSCTPANGEADKPEQGDDQPRHPQHTSSFIDGEVMAGLEPGTAFETGSDVQKMRSTSPTLAADLSTSEDPNSSIHTHDSPISMYRPDFDFKSIMLSASHHPLVTKESLSELDINRVINNIKLRHDVNFDRELHFRPNLDGEKGCRKLEQAEMYWKALVAEFIMSLSARDPQSHLSSYYDNVLTALRQEPVTDFGHLPKRIPLMFETVSDILKILVPAHHHASIDARLDVPMLMQQISKGLFDFTGLSRWLAILLKEHCAPIRDESVNNMEEKIKSGVEQANLGVIVEGLKLLFGVLETMKLDVANHQIRSLKPLLIEDTIDFEQRYYLRKIATQRLDVKEIAKWFTNAKLDTGTDSSSGNDQGRRSRTIFFKALVRSLLTSDQECQITDHQIFAFDRDRLEALQKEIQDLIYLETCCELFFKITRYLEYSGPPLSNITPILRQSIITIVKHSSAERCWHQNLTNVALEIVRTAHCVCGSENLTDLELVHFAEDYLQQDLQIESDRYQQIERAMEQALISMVLNKASSCAELSPLAIYDCSNPRRCTRIFGGATQGLDEIAKHIAHIGILHWRVWAPLIYLRPPTQSSQI